MGHHSNHFQVNGQSIKQFRAALGWSQAALADRAGYSERLVRKAEAGGKISLQALRDLAEASEKFGPAVQAEMARGKASGLYVDKTELTGKDGGAINVQPILQVVTS